MIFGSKKHSGVSEDITKSVQPCIDRVSTKHGLPNGFWDDPYTLGFILGQINGWMAVLGGESLSVGDKGKVVVECFGALSGQKGKPISEMSMVFAQDKNTEFLRANQNGMFIAMYSGGKLPNSDQHAAIIDAVEELTESGEEVKPASIARMLVDLHWVEEIQERFSVGAR